MVKPAVQQGRSEVHGAKPNERTLVDAGEMVSRWCLGAEGVTFLPVHPTPAGTGSFSVRYVEGLNEARTKLARLFSLRSGYSSVVDFRCLISRAR
jgi:hypothetical protein